MLNLINTHLLALIVGLLILLAAEVGHQLAKRTHADRSADASFDAIQSATFTVVGLLLAFTFSVALARYDARRVAVVGEANAIGTAILRAGLLDNRTANEMRADLRNYLVARIAFAAADSGDEERKRFSEVSEKLQRKMWDLAISASRDQHSTTVPLFLSSLNQMIDASSQQAAAASAHIPDAIMLVLIVVVLITAGVLGFRTGRSGRRGAVPILLAIVLAFVVATILDLDRPQRGLIRVDLGPLMNDQKLLAEWPSGK